MNRRQAIIGAALVAVAPLFTNAQDANDAIVSRYLEMLNTQDWSIADEIMSPDYAPPMLPMTSRH